MLCGLHLVRIEHVDILILDELFAVSTLNPEPYAPIPEPLILDHKL